MIWHLLLDREPGPGWRNMAVDVALQQRASGSGHGYLRLYRWSPHCLSFGRHEPALRRYDRALIEARHIDTVRRPTGGRAVWHAGELTYAVAAPDGAMGSVREAYGRIHASIATALQSLGAGVTLAPAPPRAPALDAGACFATAAGGEIVADGLKVAGSAQARSGGALLQHGSILLRDDQSLIDSVTRGGRAMPAVAPLSRLLHRDVSWDEVASALVIAVASWGDWTDLPDRSHLADEADALSHPFRDTAWTWQR